MEELAFELQAVCFCDQPFQKQLVWVHTVDVSQRTLVQPFSVKLVLEADLRDTTLSRATSLRHAYDKNSVFRVNQTYNSLTTVVYVKNIVVGF